MMVNLRTSAVAVSAAALVAGLAAALVPAVGAEAEEVPPTHNWVTLQTGSAPQLAFYRNAAFPATTTPTATDAEFGPLPRCGLGSDGSLIEFAGEDAGGRQKGASLARGSLGVPEKNGGTSCSRVDTDEVLTLRLGDSFDGPGLPVALSSAVLEVDLKQNSRIQAVATLDGVEQGTFELQSGSTVDPADSGDPAVFQCLPGSDSGPDVQTRDNCYWPISAPEEWFAGQNVVDDDGVFFDQLELTSLDGSFALQGGAETGVPGGVDTTADFLPQRSTFFGLSYDADGELICGASTETEAGTATAPEITVTRLDNANPDEVCTLIPYTLENGASSARFLKPLDQELSAQFVLDMVWTLDAGDYRRTSDPTYVPPSIPQTTIDFETSDPRSDIVLGWCPDPLYDGDTLTGVADPLANDAVVDLDSTLAGKQFACLGSQSTVVDDGSTSTGGADDTLIVHEQIYLLGDARMRK